MSESRAAACMPAAVNQHDAGSPRTALLHVCIQREHMIVDAPIDDLATDTGYDVIAFIGIYLEKSSLYDSVAKELQKIPEIVRLNYTTGNYSMFAEIVCKDILGLRAVLHGNLQKIKGIERTETFISLDESFNRNVKVIEE